MTVFLSILVGAMFVGLVYLMSKDSQSRQTRSRRKGASGSGTSDIFGSSDSDGFDCGADGGCD
jgi:hypothetical protein